MRQIELKDVQCGDWVIFREDDMYILSLILEKSTLEDGCPKIKELNFGFNSCNNSISTIKIETYPCNKDIESNSTFYTKCLSPREKSRETN